MRTPLVRLELDNAPADLCLKLECPQAIGSFKLRGAGHPTAVADAEALAHSVCTAGAGNMGQGVAWSARRLDLPCVVVPA